MTRKPRTMPPGRAAIKALCLMRDGGFRHIPVLEQQVLRTDRLTRGPTA
jgi:hypothetical protein